MTLPHRAIFLSVWERYQKCERLSDFEETVLQALLKYP